MEDKGPGRCDDSEGHRHAAAVTRGSGVFLLGASKGGPSAGVTRLSAAIQPRPGTYRGRRGSGHCRRWSRPDLATFSVCQVIVLCVGGEWRRVATGHQGGVTLSRGPHHSIPPATPVLARGCCRGRLAEGRGVGRFLRFLVNTSSMAFQEKGTKRVGWGGEGELRHPARCCPPPGGVTVGGSHWSSTNQCQVENGGRDEPLPARLSGSTRLVAAIQARPAHSGRRPALVLAGRAVR